MDVEEHTVQLDGQPVHFWTASGNRVLFLHGAPTSSADWSTALTQIGGIAPDLPGFGRSGKGGHLDLTRDGYAAFLPRFLDATGQPANEPLHIVAHGWGAAVALRFAALEPDRVGRVVLFNPVAPVPGFVWPRVIRTLQRRVIGELVLGATNRALLARTLQSGAISPDAWPPERLDEVWRDFDQGTQRALLRIHRATPTAELAAGSSELTRITAPTLVLHGQADPWLDAGISERLALCLADARSETVTGAGHWPWLDRPEILAQVAAFLL